MVHQRQGRIWREQDLHRLVADLLARQHYRLLNRGVQIAGEENWRPGPGVEEQVVQNVLDMPDLLLDVSHNRAAGAIGGQVFAHHVHNPRNSGQRVANLVRQACGELAECRQVFRARHLTLVKFLEFPAALVQLLDHFIELAAQPADVVVALGKFHTRGEVAMAHAFDGIHQFFQWTFHEHEQDGEQHKTQQNSKAQRRQQNPLCVLDLQ